MVPAEPSEGRTAAAVATRAQRHRFAIHCGYAERDISDHFNAAQCFGPDVHALKRHRTLAMPPGFKTRHFIAGPGCGLFRFHNILLAKLLRCDVKLPEAVRHVAALGAQVVLAPTALASIWRWVVRMLIPARAFEDGVCLAYANHAGTENGLEYLGESVIAGPDGEEMVRASDAPGPIMADLTVHGVVAAQARLQNLKERQHLALRRSDAAS